MKINPADKKGSRIIVRRNLAFYLSVNSSRSNQLQFADLVNID